MPLKDFYQLGDYNAVCAQCGRKRKASEMKRHWQGYYVCLVHWEPRHTQDFVRARKETLNVPWVQPKLQHPYITFFNPWESIDIPTGLSACAVAGIAIAGVAISGVPLSGNTNQ